jgi:hypothetical protein
MIASTICMIVSERSVHNLSESKHFVENLRRPVKKKVGLSQMGRNWKYLISGNFDNFPLIGWMKKKQNDTRKPPLFL